MKKLIIIMTILLLTGCGVKEKANLIISSDKNVEFQLLEAYNNELIDAYLNDINETNKTYSDSERWQCLEDEYSNVIEQDPEIILEKYEVDDYKGYRIIKNIGNIDSITGDDAGLDISEDLNIANNKIFVKEGNKYISKLHFTKISINEGVDYDLTFSVTLPVEPISHNAHKVSEDKKTLIWNLVSTKDIEINFEFEFSEEKKAEENKIINSKNNLIIIVGISVLAIVAIVIFILKRKNKEEF